MSAGRASSLMHPWTGRHRSRKWVDGTEPEGKKTGTLYHQYIWQNVCTWSLGDFHMFFWVKGINLVRFSGCFCMHCFFKWMHKMLLMLGLSPWRTWQNCHLVHFDICSGFNTIWFIKIFCSPQKMCFECVEHFMTHPFHFYQCRVSNSFKNLLTLKCIGTFTEATR